MEVRSQRASIRATGAAPQILPAAARSSPSSRPEVRKRVAQNDLQLHVVLSNAACKVGRRIRQRGFLVGWYNLIFESADLRRLRSDARTGRVLGAVLCPSCASLTDCRASQTNQRWSNVWGQKPFSPHIRSGNQQFKRVLTFIRDLQNLGIPWILTRPLSSQVWRTTPVCLLEQHHRSHSIIFDQCAFHVCALSRRPHIQLHGSDLSGRQFTARCKVLPPGLCSKLCNIIISREIGNR